MLCFNPIRGEAISQIMYSKQGLYTVDQIKKLEQLYANMHSGETYALMERAGATVAIEIKKRWPKSQNILVMCGSGNNAGDGFVVARLLAQSGRKVTVVELSQAKKKGDAARAYARLDEVKVNYAPWDVHLLEQQDILVDALLGTGITGALKPEYLKVIDAVNATAIPVVAVDLPSGLDANTGMVRQSAVKAELTMTFIGVKRGLLTGDAADYCGEIVLKDLDCGSGIFSLVEPDAYQFRYQQGIKYLKPRPRVSHKGHFGHVLIIGGDLGYSGAITLTGEAALRTGAGLVSLLTHPDHVMAVASQRPEMMVHGLSKSAITQQLQHLLEKANVIVIGPGLGTDSWGRALLSEFQQCYKKLAKKKGKGDKQGVWDKKSIWDADALNLLAEDPKRDDCRVITPHPGEASRLLDTSVSQVQSDRFACARQLQSIYGGVCLLKGAGTVIADVKYTHVMHSGNPGMASGGMGDLLSGIIAGLIAQALPLDKATCLGAAIHAEAADLAVTGETVAIKAAPLERGLLASDLLSYVRELVNPIVEHDV